MVEKLSIDSLIADFNRIGVRRGDTVYVRSRASSVGRLQQRDGLFLALLEAVGPNGTLVFPAFTGVGFRWSKHKQRFDLQAPTESGAVSKLALEHPKAVRSSHPTHSFVAIGPSAADILEGHDYKAAAFYPVRKMIDNRAKMLLIGCGRESPGFSTVHYAQEQLGLSQKHLTRYLYRVQIERGGVLADWFPSEDPGCSMGFDKLYLEYLRAEILEVGWIGRAYSLIATADRLYDVDYKCLTKNPLAVVCDRPDCVSCRILRPYNISAAPMALVRWFLARARRT